MKTNLVKKENATATVSVVAEQKDWEEAQAKAFQKIKSKLKLKGFRSGAAIPDELAKPHIQEAEIFNEGLNVILPSLYEGALKENNLVPFMQPSVNVTKISNVELEVSFDIPLYPEVELGTYKGIKVELEESKVEEKEIDASLRKLALEHADLVVTEADHKALKGDTVIIDFTGYVDGKAFDGGSAENYALELGSNQFVPGFEDQLVGAVAGADVDVNVTFPEQYVKELAGKKALFKVKVHEVKAKLIPEVNEDFIAELNYEGVASIEDLRKHEEQRILEQKQRSAKAKQFNELIKTIVDGTKIEIGEAVLTREVEAMKEDINNRMAQNGLTLQQYLEITNMTLEKLEEQLKNDATKNLSTFLTLNKIAEVEGLKVEEADVTKELEEMAKQYNMTVEKIKEILGDNINRMASEILNRKIETFLKENNNL